MAIIHKVATKSVKTLNDSSAAVAVVAETLIGDVTRLQLAKNCLTRQVAELSARFA